jgi:hypothetical protein
MTSTVECVQRLLEVRLPAPEPAVQALLGAIKQDSKLSLDVFKTALTACRAFLYGAVQWHGMTDTCEAAKKVRADVSACLATCLSTGCSIVEVTLAVFQLQTWCIRWVQADTMFDCFTVLSAVAFEAPEKLAKLAAKRPLPDQSTISEEVTEALAHMLSHCAYMSRRELSSNSLGHWRRLWLSSPDSLSMWTRHVVDSCFHAASCVAGSRVPGEAMRKAMVKACSDGNYKDLLALFMLPNISASVALEAVVDVAGTAKDLGTGMWYLWLVWLNQPLQYHIDIMDSCPAAVPALLTCVCTTVGGLAEHRGPMTFLGDYSLYRPCYYAVLNIVRVLCCAVQMAGLGCCCAEDLVSTVLYVLSWGERLAPFAEDMFGSMVGLVQSFPDSIRLDEGAALALADSALGLVPRGGHLRDAMLQHVKVLRRRWSAHRAAFASAVARAVLARAAVAAAVKPASRKRCRRGL